MGIEIVRHADGRVLLRQRLVRPVVYLDHWAVRLFSEDLPLQDRFVHALQQSRGTWLFACANLMEFVAMTDLDQAVAAEELLRRAMPSVYVADLYSDPGFALSKKAVPSDDPPDEHWMLKDLAARAHIAGGTLNTTRFVQEAVLQRAVLLPLFEEFKKQVVNAIRASAADQEKQRLASKFKSVAAMNVGDALLAELLREPHINQSFRIDDHHAMDLVHTVPAATVCDYLLLDRGWTARLNSAADRMQRAGVRGKVGRAFAEPHLQEFFDHLVRDENSRSSC
jgi:hypothetical protein